MEDNFTNVDDRDDWEMIQVSQSPLVKNNAAAALDRHVRDITMHRWRSNIQSGFLIPVDE